MNKASYYQKRFINPNSYNYFYNNYGYPYKKTYFRNNKQINNIYNEEREKNPFYNTTNFNDSYNYYDFQRKSKFKYLYNTEANFEEEENVENEKKEEIIKLKINVRDGVKELVICKDEDIDNAINKFCKQNFIDERLIEPLINKIKNSIIKIESIKNLELDKKDISIINKLKYLNQNNNK